MSIQSNLRSSTSHYLKVTSREYSIYVCDSRGIAFVGDGLKDGQRIALWLLRNRAEKMKTIALSGLMGYERLYVHGDVSANNAINLLAAPFKNNIPLIEGIGQFGSRLLPVEGIGAPRYTEVKRSKAASAFLYNDLDIVPMMENYDGSNVQPVHLLPIIPTILLNGVKGVAVGWATDIQPRSLKSLIAGVQAVLMDKKVPNLDPHYDAYDITVRPTGQPNQYEYTGKVEKLDTSSVRVTEIPPGLTIDAFRKRLNDLEEKDVILSCTDRSAEYIDIVVKFKRGTIKDTTEDQLVEMLKIKEKVTENLVVRNWDRESIRTYDNAEALLREFTEWRLGWYSTRYEKLIADAEYELAYWQALEVLVKRKFPAKLGTYENKAGMLADVVRILEKDKMDIAPAHHEKIVSLATYRWTKEFEAEIEQKIATITADVVSYKDIHASPSKLRDVYFGELEALKKAKL